MISNTISSLAEGPDGNIWIGTFEGVSTFKYKLLIDRMVSSDSYGRFALNGNNNRGLGKLEFKNYKLSKGLANDVVYTILIDKNNIKWFGLLGGIVGKLDGKSWSIIEPFDKHKYPKAIRTIAVDKKGNLFFPY